VGLVSMLAAVEMQLVQSMRLGGQQGNQTKFSVVPNATWYLHNCHNTSWYCFLSQSDIWKIMFLPSVGLWMPDLKFKQNKFDILGCHGILRVSKWCKYLLSLRKKSTDENIWTCDRGSNRRMEKIM
jgi:hypothetical protein